MLTVKLFYADWCGACRGFKPDWEKIMKEIKNDPQTRNKVKFENFNLDQNKKLVEDLGINQIPTLVFEINGKNYKYTGDRKMDVICKKIKTICNDKF